MNDGRWEAQLASAAAGLPPGAPVSFILRADDASAGQLVTVLDRHGLRIERVMPLGLAIRSGRAAGSLLHGHTWGRLLTWAAVDRRLFDFLQFVETELLARLPHGTTDRSSVEAVKTADPPCNAAWAQRDAACAARLRAGVSKESIEPLLSLDWETWRHRLGVLLEHRGNRVVLFRLLSAVPEHIPVQLGDFVSEQVAREIEGWLAAHALDERIIELLGRWHTAGPIAAILEHRGVPLGPSLAYPLMRDALDAFGAFEDDR